jgi:cell shape determining protein, MreB/Mrl family
MAAIDIGIDLGTTNILVYARGKGVVLKEPSVVAFDKDADKIKAIGEEARQMIGRTPGNITAIRPIRKGVISDYSITERMLKYFIQKAMGRRMFRKPRINICVPSGVTAVEKRAVEEATYQAGAREVNIIPSAVAATIGAGIDITRAFGNLVIDIGGGTTDIAVVSLGDVVVSTSIPVAGNDFDQAIIRYVKRQHNLFIGGQTAEAIKMKIGDVYPQVELELMTVKGRNVISGLPKTVTLTSEEIREAFKEVTSKIVEAVQGVLETTPPELANDISSRGIILTGGGAMIKGMEALIEEVTGINAMISERPDCAVVIGTGLYTEVMEKLGK